MKNCKECVEDIKEEYIFYATLNDKDKNYEFDIDKDLEKKFDKLYDDIVNGDKRMLIRYSIISVIITFLLFLTLILAIKFVFN